MGLFSIGVLFSDLASSSEPPMLARVWPFFLALLALGVVLAVYFALKEARGDKQPPPSEDDRT